MEVIMAWVLAVLGVSVVGNVVSLFGARRAKKRITNLREELYSAQCRADAEEYRRKTLDEYEARPRFDHAEPCPACRGVYGRGVSGPLGQYKIDACSHWDNRRSGGARELLFLRVTCRTCGDQFYRRPPKAKKSAK